MLNDVARRWFLRARRQHSCASSMAQHVCCCLARLRTGIDSTKNPTSTWSPKGLRPRSGSSHYVYTNGTLRLTVPYKRPYVKEVYVKEVLRLIDQLTQGEE